MERSRLKFRSDSGGTGTSVTQAASLLEVMEEIWCKLLVRVRKDAVLTWHNRTTYFILGSIWDLIWVHTCHLASHVAGRVGPWPHLRLISIRVWHAPHSLAHPLFPGVARATLDCSFKCFLWLDHERWQMINPVIHELYYSVT